MKRFELIIVPNLKISSRIGFIIPNREDNRTNEGYFSFMCKLEIKT